MQNKTSTPRRERRALSHVGGRITLTGSDERARSVIEHALGVSADESATMAHVHGFHSYPARLHPVTAARLIEGLSKPGDVVLDPFCGSGTVLVEARRLGRAARGVDSNPLAIELAWLKTLGLPEGAGARLLEAAAHVTEHAEDRRLKKAGPTRRYPPQDRELFDIHVLLELDGLADGIDQLGDPVARRMLGLVLSALLTKVSRKSGDSSEQRQSRRLAAGYTIKLFRKKTEELVKRASEYEALLPPDAPPAKAMPGDARRLRGVGKFDLVVSSPPYPGVYDYLAHHEMRLRWLRLDAKQMDRAEIGSRRALGKLSFEHALDQWRKDFGDVLRALSKSLAPKGAIALVIADSTLAGRAVWADEIVSQLAPAAGLSVVAAGAQPRPHFHGPSQRAFRDKPRREHVLVLRPSASERRAPPEPGSPRTSRWRRGRGAGGSAR